MATDFSKVLGRIEDENDELKKAHAALAEAFEKLDGKLTRLGARVRIEPYEVDKKAGLVIGYRRFELTWRISTVVSGLAGTSSELPVSETKPDIQVALMPHVAGLLDKVATAVAAEAKQAQGAVVEAKRLIDAIEAAR